MVFGVNKIPQINLMEVTKDCTWRKTWLCARHHIRLGMERRVRPRSHSPEAQRLGEVMGMKIFKRNPIYMMVFKAMKSFGQIT
jgi:hypothetical protein